MRLIHLLAGTGNTFCLIDKAIFGRLMKLSDSLTVRHLANRTQWKRPTNDKPATDPIAYLLPQKVKEKLC
jgi:hypothetical protein